MRDISLSPLMATSWGASNRAISSTHASSKNAAANCGPHSSNTRLTPRAARFSNTACGLKLSRCTLLHGHRRLRLHLTRQQRCVLPRAVQVWSQPKNIRFGSSLPAGRRAANPGKRQSRLGSSVDVPRPVTIASCVARNMWPMRAITPRNPATRRLGCA